MWFVSLAFASLSKIDGELETLGFLIQATAAGFACLTLWSILNRLNLFEQPLH